LPAYTKSKFELCGQVAFGKMGDFMAEYVWISIQLFSKDGSFEPKGATKHPRLMEIEFRTARKLEPMI